MFAHRAPRAVRFARSMTSQAESSAEMLFVIRHAERLDRQDPSWSHVALRPQDTPLSQRGVRQAERLGKWLYGRLPVNRPLAIFVSPFIRCVQTANAIAEQLEGLQREGLHSASATRICVEPGLCEDMSYMSHLPCREPWYMHAADLMCVSPRVDLKYKPLRDVKFERGAVYPGGCVEQGSTEARVATIALEIADHPLVRNGGTALLVTHGKPSTEMVRALNPAPGGTPLPPYDAIKAGHYDGPPLQYTATTAMRRRDDGVWDLADGFELFSNAHDPRLALLKSNKRSKVTRYVLGTRADAAVTPFSLPAGGDAVIAAADLAGAEAGDELTVSSEYGDLKFTLPDEYRCGDYVKCRVLAPRVHEFYAPPAGARAGPEADDDGGAPPPRGAAIDAAEIMEAA